MSSAALLRAFEFTQAEGFVEANHHVLQARLEMLEVCWAEFCNACRQSVMRPEANAEENGMSLERGEGIYLETKASLRSRCAILTSGAAAQLGQSDNNVLQIQWSDMPSQEKLPMFAGDFAKWAPFRDAFIAEVHNNAKLTNAQRLRKLMACLEGAAKRAVGEWSVADDGNYLLAWNSLRQQYYNNHQTIRAHLQEISALLPIRAKSLEDLRDVLDTVRVNRRHLLSLLEPAQLVDFQFFHQIEQLLDTEGRHEWEMRRRANDLPSLDDMFRFLEHRANFLASFAIGTNVPRLATSNSREEPRNAPRLNSNTVQRPLNSSQSAAVS